MKARERVAVLAVVAAAVAGCGLGGGKNSEPRRVSSDACDCSIMVPGGSIKAPFVDDVDMAYVNPRTGLGIVVGSEDATGIEALPILKLGELMADLANEEDGIERDGPCEAVTLDGREAAQCPMKGDVVLMAIVPTPKRYVTLAITIDESNAKGAVLARKLGAKLFQTFRSSDPRAAATAPAVEPAPIPQD